MHKQCNPSVDSAMDVGHIPKFTHMDGTDNPNSSGGGFSGKRMKRIVVIVCFTPSLLSTASLSLSHFLSPYPLLNRSTVM